MADYTSSHGFERDVALEIERQRKLLQDKMVFGQPSNDFPHAHSSITAPHNFARNEGYGVGPGFNQMRSTHSNTSTFPPHSQSQTINTVNEHEQFFYREPTLEQRIPRVIIREGDLNLTVTAVPKARTQEPGLRMGRTPEKELARKQRLKYGEELRKQMEEKNRRFIMTNTDQFQQTNSQALQRAKETQFETRDETYTRGNDAHTRFRFENMDPVKQEEILRKRQRQLELKSILDAQMAEKTSHHQLKLSQRETISHLEPSMYQLEQEKVLDPPHHAFNPSPRHEQRQFQELAVPRHHSPDFYNATPLPQHDSHQILGKSKITHKLHPPSESSYSTYLRNPTDCIPAMDEYQFVARGSTLANKSMKQHSGNNNTRAEIQHNFHHMDQLSPSNEYLNQTLDRINYNQHEHGHFDSNFAHQGAELNHRKNLDVQNSKNFQQQSFFVPPQARTIHQDLQIACSENTNKQINGCNRIYPTHDEDSVQLPMKTFGKFEKNSDVLTSQNFPTVTNHVKTISGQNTAYIDTSTSCNADLSTRHLVQHDLLSKKEQFVETSDQWEASLDSDSIFRPLPAETYDDPIYSQRLYSSLRRPINPLEQSLSGSSQLIPALHEALGSIPFQVNHDSTDTLKDINSNSDNQCISVEKSLAGESLFVILQSLRENEETIRSGDSANGDEGVTDSSLPLESTDIANHEDVTYLQDPPLSSNGSSLPLTSTECCQETVVRTRKKWAKSPPSQPSTPHKMRTEKRPSTANPRIYSLTSSTCVKDSILVVKPQSTVHISKGNSEWEIDLCTQKEPKKQEENFETPRSQQKKLTRVIDSKYRKSPNKDSTLLHYNSSLIQSPGTCNKTQSKSFPQLPSRVFTTSPARFNSANHVTVTNKHDGLSEFPQESFECNNEQASTQIQMIGEPEWQNMGDCGRNVDNAEIDDIHGLYRKMMPKFCQKEENLEYSKNNECVNEETRGVFSSDFDDANLKSNCSSESGNYSESWIEESED